MDYDFCDEKCGNDDVNGQYLLWLSEDLSMLENLCSSKTMSWVIISCHSKEIQT